VEGCAELERKLSLAINRQHWLHQELCEMQTYVDGVRKDISTSSSVTNGALAQVIYLVTIYN